MTSTFKYKEPESRESAMAGSDVGHDGAFIRLLSLFNQNFGVLSGDVEDDAMNVENTSLSSFWYDESLFDDTSVGPCSLSNRSCHNLTNFDEDFKAEGYAVWQLVVFGLFAGCISLVTVVGNMIVIMSFIIDRAIRQPTNYFIASLAVSDLLIGSISMPFYTVYLLASESWPLGEFLCDLWLSIDYTVCLCSIYTVFFITIDRFCSVTIPAKYRNWRTEQKVLTMVAVTWVVPSLLFFISIFGWQHFVGERTVPEGKCYVQYMEEALFNCLLQVGYFWVTLVVMCVLYTGIYRVALELQRKSEAKHKKMTSLVSMAGKTMTRIGIGVTTGTVTVEEQTERTRLTAAAPHHTAANCSTLSDVAVVQPGTSADRSSSPAFQSDTDQGSGAAATSRHNGSTKTAPTGVRQTTVNTAAAVENDADDAGIYMGPDTETPAVVDVANAENKNKTPAEMDIADGNACNQSKGDISSQLKQPNSATNGKEDAKSNKSDNDVRVDGRMDTKKLLTPNKKDAVCSLSPSDKSQQHHLSLSSIDSMSKGFRSRSQRDRSSCSRSNSGRKQRPGSIRLVGHRGKKSSGKRKDGAADGGHRGAGPTPAQQAQSKSENRARKALRTITVILGAFVLCWTPWHVLSMIMGFCMECVPGALYNVSYLLCYLNSPINPFCYALANQQFKKTFARILRFDWRRT